MAKYEGTPEELDDLINICIEKLKSEGKILDTETKKEIKKKMKSIQETATGNQRIREEVYSMIEKKGDYQKAAYLTQKYKGMHPSDKDRVHMKMEKGESFEQAIKNVKKKTELVGYG